MQSRDIYTIAQLAQRWQCSPDAIYDMVRRGDIKSFRVGTAMVTRSFWPTEVMLP